MRLANFRQSEPALRVLYGADCLAQLATELRRVGARRAVIFCGRSLAHSRPGAQSIQAALGDLCAGVFDGVRQHSPLPSVLAGAEALANLHADAVLALGGGSAIVTARAASVLLAERVPLEQLCTRQLPGQAPHSPRLSAPKLPQLLIPTTPTSAAVRAGAAITEPSEHRRLTIFDPKVRPAAIFLCPELFCATPNAVVMDAALNTLASILQGLESTRRQPLADARLLHALRLMVRHLPPLAQARASAEEARGQLMLAAVLAGQGVDSTGAGLAAALAHAIGTRFAVGNGTAAAIVLPHTLRLNAAASAEGSEDVLEALGRGAAPESTPGVSERCAALFERLGVPARLRDVGVGQEDLPPLAERAAEDWFTSQNPVRVRCADILELLRAAW